MPVKDVNPQGTIEELEERGLSAEEYGSCAKPVPGEVIGCSFWKACTMSYKGKDGPHNHPCRIIKPESLGGGVREVAMTCYGAIPMKEQWEKRGGAFQIIGNEGDAYTVQGSRLICEKDADGNAVKDAAGRTKPLAGMDGKSPAHYELFIDTEIVQPFPRPGLNSRLTKSAYAAKVLRDARAKAERERGHAAIGLVSTTHLDKENAEAPKDGRKPGRG